MALLSKEKRKEYFKYLGLGEYNKDNITKFQKMAFTRKSDIDGEYGINTDRALRHFRNVKKYTKAEHFKPEEFKCTCGHCTGYPSWMKKVELQNLQAIRDHYKKPMIVTSGLRCKFENNSSVGSISTSKHLSGYACDIYMAGVTDTLANRRNAIKWIKTLPNHGYSYGNGYNSNGVYVRAPYMGNALHTDTNPAPKKEKKEPTNAEKLAAKAYEFAYHSNTSKASYPKGAPKEAYKKALDECFGKKRPWAKAAKLGASCDVFVATCIRAAGIDKDAPRGMVRSWLDKSSKFKRVKVTKNTVKDGDIISINWSNGNPHWCIAYGGKILEASFNGWWPKTTNTLASRLSKKGKQSVVVYRAK